MFTIILCVDMSETLDSIMKFMCIKNAAQLRCARFDMERADINSWTFTRQSCKKWDF